MIAAEIATVTARITIGSTISTETWPVRLDAVALAGVPKAQWPVGGIPQNSLAFSDLYTPTSFYLISGVYPQQESEALAAAFVRWQAGLPA